MGMYEIDTKCGTDDILYDEDLLQENYCIIKLLEEDKQVFELLYEKNLNLIDDIESKKLFENFANLILKFNGYDAPINYKRDDNFF